MNLFELRGVEKHYGSTRALAPLDLDVVEGRSLGIIGESGSGKTTLIRLMMGIHEPTSGIVTYRGMPVSTKRGPVPLRREAQLVLQDPFAALNPRMRVGQIVGEPLRIHKINQPHRVAEVLAEVGLDAEYAERYPHQLSGGQRQRVAIARALAPRPRVILADEPVSALDVSLRVMIVDLLDELRRALNLTLVIVSHDIGVVQQLCEDVVVMKDGICVERGQTPKLLRHPREQATKELLAATMHLPI
ncbi:ABC transporter ATP-binding protein [Trueperella pyogenes]|uniref:ABC transporter ATP-binding protein n=1 Tax=Trueperella pyogenes TaxID=1661 RepID=UPI00345D6DA1